MRELAPGLVIFVVLFSTPVAAQNAFKSWVECLHDKATRFAESTESVEAVVRISIVACRREHEKAMSEDSKMMDMVGLYEIDKVLLGIMESRLKR